MKTAILAALLSIGIPASAFSQVKTMAKTASPLAHVSNRFTLTVHAPFHEAALLFGPKSERKWAGGDWDPQFVFPSPVKTSKASYSPSSMVLAGVCG